MSVLLVLALAAAPANGCAGPRPGWLAPVVQPPNRHFNRITLSGRDRILWNGIPITRRILHQYLDILATMNPLPLTILVARDDADCASLEVLRDEIEAVLPCAAQACGEGVGPWTEQDVHPPPAPPPPAPPRRAPPSDR